MTNSTLHRFSALPIPALLGALALVFGSFGASAQVYTRTQNFSSGTVPGSTAPTNSPQTTTSLSFAVTSISNAASYGYYNTSFVRSSTGGAFGVEDPNNSATANTLVLDFAPQVIQKNATGNQITFQLGSNGFDQFNQVRVDVTVNGAATRVLTLTGPSGGGVSFGVGSGATATVNYPAAQSLTMGAGGTGNVVINLPSFTTRTTVGLTIAIDAAKKAVNLVDNVTISSGSPLPVELTRFEATAKGTGVSLDWATASEKNSDRFEIQRSATGEVYETLGKVQGQGNTTLAHTYAFVDSRPLAGTAYYRLRQVDSDGTFSFSPVAAVQTEASTKVTFYPNPSANQLILPAGVGTVQYRVFNALGQTLLSGKATDNGRLDISSLPKGPFFLELSGATGRHTQRLLRE